MAPLITLIGIEEACVGSELIGSMQENKALFPTPWVQRVKSNQENIS